MELLTKNLTAPAPVTGIFMLYNISICLTDLVNIPDEAAKQASNGKFYLNCSLWINDQENESGSIGSVTLDKKDAEGKTSRIYIANVRKLQKKDDEKDTKSWKENLAR
jgi:hypothetical protein